MTIDFDDMDEAGQDKVWASFNEGGYEIQDDDETLGEHDGALTGSLVAMKDNVGEYDSRVYTVSVSEYDRLVAFWGGGSIDNQVDNAGIEEGDIIGVLHTGETGESENGKFPIFDVRYDKVEQTIQTLALFAAYFTVRRYTVTFIIVGCVGSIVMVDYKCPDCGAVEEYKVVNITPGGHTMECTECGSLFTDGSAVKFEAGR